MQVPEKSKRLLPWRQLEDRVPYTRQHLSRLEKAGLFPKRVQVGGNRVAIANENVPNMVGQISTCLAEAGLNIADLLNKSRGDLAYTIIDTEAPIPPEVLARLRAIPGVLSARTV